MELIYTATNLTIDAQHAKSRIAFYLERDNFLADGIDEITLIFSEELPKDDLLKVDVSMSTFGYIRM